MTQTAKRALRPALVVFVLLALLAVHALATAQPARPTLATLQAQIGDLQRRVAALNEHRDRGVQRREIDELSRRLDAFEDELKRTRDALPGDWRPDVARLTQDLEQERSERTNRDQRFATKEDLNRETAGLQGLPGTLAVVDQRVGALEQALATLQSQVGDLITSANREPVQPVPLNPLVDTPVFASLFAPVFVPEIPIVWHDVDPPENDLIPFLFTLAIAGALGGANTWQQYRARLRARIATEVATSGEETQTLWTRERDEGPRHVVCYQFVGGMDAQEENDLSAETDEQHDGYVRREKVA